jgi:hypothetical protein
MLHRRVLRIEEILAKHKLFLPQEVLRRENMDYWSLEKTQLQMMISTERDVIE